MRGAATEALEAKQREKHFASLTKTDLLTLPTIARIYKASGTFKTPDKTKPATDAPPALKDKVQTALTRVQSVTKPEVLAKVAAPDSTVAKRARGKSRRVRYTDNKIFVDKGVTIPVLAHETGDHLEQIGSTVRSTPRRRTPSYYEHSGAGGEIVSMAMQWLADPHTTVNRRRVAAPSPMTGSSRWPSRETTDGGSARPSRLVIRCASPRSRPSTDRCPSGSCASSWPALNWHLPIGNFEVDTEGKSIRCKTAIDVGGDRITPAPLRHVVWGNVSLMDRYLPAITAVVDGSRAPADAVASVEGVGPG